MMPYDRRQFLKQATAASLAAGLFPATIGKALSLPARNRTGTLQDVEHVVILMQENRSFDHYFGTLRGVRGFGDPRPSRRPDGRSLFEQSEEPGGTEAVLPFPLHTADTAANCMTSLDHSWKGSHARWRHHDVWVPEKSPLCMGYLTRADIPYYYALADAFTICDAYHCSIHGPTYPNRLYSMSGSNGLSVGHHGGFNIANEADDNNNADSAKDDPKFAGHGWTSYAERLQEAGISWKLYQEYDNYSINTLAHFANFRGLPPQSPLYQRARSWVPGSTEANAEASRGEHLVAAFAADVAADRLPAVSWIIPPFIMCEHPDASPAYGEVLVSRLIAALVANPAVWAKTVFILNYDENDGFFDHVPPPVPAINPAMGGSTVDVRGEVYESEPVGFGPRVPMLLVSPWSRGGWVNSQLFDHTSVLRFLEKRFEVPEPNISPWRRAVAGDLTSAFDFTDSSSQFIPLALPDTSGNFARSDASCALRQPAPPRKGGMPWQEPGQRGARALPYRLHVHGRMDADGLRLTYVNRGLAGAVFTSRTFCADRAGPWYHTVEAARSLSHHWPMPSGQAYRIMVDGPNGFLREFEGIAMAQPDLEAVISYEEAGELALVLTVLNRGPNACALEIQGLDYDLGPSRRVLLPATVGRHRERWSLTGSKGWYDVQVRAVRDEQFRRRFAGHVENGHPSVSDPALGRVT